MLIRAKRATFLLACGATMLQLGGCDFTFAIRDGFFAGITNAVATVITTTLLNATGQG